MQALATTAEVITALGGNAKVRKITGAKSQQAVFNWVARGNFPPDTYVPITRGLAELGLTAAQSLWKAVPVSAVAEVVRLSDEPGKATRWSSIGLSGGQS